MDQSINVSEIGIIVNQLCKRVDHLEQLAGVGQLAPAQPYPTLPAPLHQSAVKLEPVLSRQPEPLLELERQHTRQFPRQRELAATAPPDLSREHQFASAPQDPPLQPQAAQLDPPLPALPDSDLEAGWKPALQETARQERKQTGRQGEGVEIWIGRHLNRIGIALLVIGCSFGIVYEFQYFGAWMKIASGLIAGILLLAGGAWSEDKPTFQWWGRGITGGGWALIYFTVFAAHHFPSVRVIYWPLLDLLLLASVSAGAVLHSLKFKSEAITSIALLLGFITTGLSQVTFFSLASSFLLLAAMTWIVRKTGWHSFLVWGQFLFSGLYCLLIAPQVNVDGLPFSMPSAVLKLACAALAWLAFNIMIMSFSDEKVAKHQLIAASLINASVFVGQALSIMDPPLLHLQSTIDPPLSHWRFLLLVLVSACYAAMAKVCAKRNLPMMETVQTTLALFLATSGLPFQFHASSLIELWLMEIPLLLWCGIQFSNSTVRRFAIALSIFMAARISLSDILITQHAFETGSRALETGTTQTLNLCVSSLSFFASALICHWRKDTKLLVHYRWFFAAALAFTCTLAGLECAPDWLPLAQATIFAIPVAIGLHQRDRFLRTVGAIGMVCFVMPNLIGRTWSPFAVLPIVPLTFSISALYDKAKDQDLLMDKVWIKSTYRSLALYVLVQLTHQMFSGIPLLIGWSAEALVILWIGLRKDDKFMGIAAAAILTLVTGKWFAVDLFSAAQFMGFKAAVPSSFLAAGALLAAAFMYKGEADSGRLNAVNSDNAAVTPAQPAAKAWKNWFVGYFLAALSIGVASNWFNADPGIRIFILIAEFAVCLLTGMQLGMANLRAIAALGTFCLGAFFVLGTYSDLNLLTTILAVLILHSISWLYRKTDSSQLAPFEAGVRSYYDCAGAVLLMVLSSLHAGNWLSVAWVLQGTALISAGFHLKEKPLRWFGLTIFGFVMMHLLFVELAHAQTIYRILSFITAGTVLLAASFAYARFSAAERLAKA